MRMTKPSCSKGGKSTKLPSTELSNRIGITEP
jgi:hypothetical protein